MHYLVQLALDQGLHHLLLDRLAGRLHRHVDVDIELESSQSVRNSLLVEGRPGYRAAKVGELVQANRILYVEDWSDWKAAKVLELVQAHWIPPVEQRRYSLECSQTLRQYLRQLL